MYKITLKRITAFFLCSILLLGILPLNLSTVQAADDSEAVSSAGLDTGNGEVLEWVIKKEITDLKDPNYGKTFFAYLYEADTGYRANASLLNESNSAVEGAFGQYFYWPNVPWVGVTAGPNAKPNKLSDIRDLTPLNNQSKDTAISNAKYIESMNSSNASGWIVNDMSQYMGGEKAEYYSSPYVPNNMLHNYKHQSREEGLDYPGRGKFSPALFIKLLKTVL